MPLLTPPTSPTTTTAPPNHTDHLDHLLETYLTHLDTYQNLRTQLSNNLADGFLSLAHANRTGAANRGCGRRYGEEGYDERMKAGRRVKVVVVVAAGEEGEGEVRNERGEGRKSIFHYDIINVESDGSSTEKKKIDNQNNNEDENQEDNHTTTTTDPLTHKKQPKPKPNSHPNPLTWYGILSPPSLRAAQSSFTTAVQDQTAQLVSVASDMVELEEEIGRVRALKATAAAAATAASAGRPEARAK